MAQDRSFFLSSVCARVSLTEYFVHFILVQVTFVFESCLCLTDKPPGRASIPNLPADIVTVALKNQPSVSYFAIIDSAQACL